NTSTSAAMTLEDTELCPVSGSGSPLGDSVGVGSPSASPPLPSSPPSPPPPPVSGGSHVGASSRVTCCWALCPSSFTSDPSISAAKVWPSSAVATTVTSVPGATSPSTSYATPSTSGRVISGPTISPSTHSACSTVTLPRSATSVRGSTSMVTV